LIPLPTPGRALKSYILILTLIFVTAFLAGMLPPPSTREQMTEAFQVVADNYRGLAGEKLFFTILLHNVVATIIVVISGVPVGIIPTFAIGANGFVLGVVYRQTAEMVGYSKAALKVLPHGVIEIPALLIAASVSPETAYLLSSCARLGTAKSDWWRRSRRSGKEENLVAQGKGVYKRGNVWWLTYVDAIGRMVRETSGTSDYKAALKKLADCRDKVAKGKEVSKPKVRNVLFAEAVEEYLKWAKPQGAYKNKEYMARDLEARFGNIPLRRFNVSMLEAFQQELIAQGKGPGTINRKMAMLKHLVHKCSDWGWVDDDTLRTVRKVKMLKERPGGFVTWRRRRSSGY